MEQDREAVLALWRLCAPKAGANYKLLTLFNHLLRKPLLMIIHKLKKIEAIYDDDSFEISQSN
ncbi:hypothetical protein QG37_06921 [Candidozyma auris]|nr:hypothetical protein QG37_06921 [[Candida] auris]